MAVLLLSCGALLATSPGAPTARQEASGEVAVARGAPGEIEVRFEVAEPESEDIMRMRVEIIVDGQTDPRLSARASTRVDGRAAVAEIGGGIDPAACRDGCEVVASVVVASVDESELELRTAWSVRLEVEYRSSVPAGAASTRVVRGNDPYVPRDAWVVLGAGIAAIAGVAFSLLGDRFGAARLLLAAGMVVPGGAVLLDPARSSVIAPAASLGRIDWDAVLLLGLALALVASVAIGLWRASFGRATVLRVVGWLNAITIGFAWWWIVADLGTYRPHEIVAATLALGLPIVAAITSVPIGVEWRHARRIGVLTSLVIGAQLLMAAAAVAAGVAGIVAFVDNALDRGPDPLTLGLAAVGVALVWQFVHGLRAWRRGRQAPLFIADVAVGLVVLPGAFFLFSQPEGGFFTIGVELRVLAAMAVGVVLVGGVGLGLVDPPLAEDQREREGGQRDEVPGIPGEGDRARSDDGA